MNLNIIHKAFVHGKPKAQPRPRAFAFNGKARVYDPGTAEGWKSCVALAFKTVANSNIEEPVEIGIELYFARPKSHFGTGRNAGKLKSSAPILHTQKPDVDNVAKGIIDALVGINVMHDDSQVITLTVCKLWCDPGQPEGARVTILKID